MAKLPTHRTALALSVTTSAVLLLVLMFEWSIVDAITPFLLLPLLALVWLSVLASLGWALVHGYRQRHDGFMALAPLLVSVCAIVAAASVPFTKIWLYANFHIDKAARERVVSGVRSGEFKPNVSYNDSLIALPLAHQVSMGGNEILVQGAPKRPFVFFFTYRGILDNYSGFLWVPSGQNPRQFLDAAEPGTEIVSYGDNWYFIGHR